MGFKTLSYKIKYSYFFDYSRKRFFKIVTTFFGIIGFVWTIVECFSWIFDNTSYPVELRSFIREHLLGGCIGAFGFSFYLHRRKLIIQKTFTNTDLTVIVQFCDIFEQDGAIIIPGSDTFDTDIPNNLVNPKTLHGQLIEKYYKNNIAALDNEITLKLNGCGNVPAFDSTLKGKKNRYSIGTAAVIKTHNQYFYLTALTYMRDTGNVDMQPQYIYDFLSNIWSFIPAHGEYHDVVNIPVIGTGLNRLPANYTNQFIVQEIVNSFFVTSKAQMFCKTLRICLHPHSYKYYNFDNLDILFCHIDNYINR